MDSRLARSLPPFDHDSSHRNIAQESKQVPACTSFPPISSPLDVGSWHLVLSGVRIGSDAAGSSRLGSIPRSARYEDRKLDYLSIHLSISLSRKNESELTCGVCTAHRNRKVWSYGQLIYKQTRQSHAVELRGTVMSHTEESFSFNSMHSLLTI